MNVADLNKLITLALKSGKMYFGSKQAIETVKLGRAEAIIVASNCPKHILSEIKNLASLSETPIYFHPASSLDLGNICSKPFAISSLTIRETNDPDIRKIIQKDG